MIKSVDRALAVLEYMSSRKSVSVTEVATEFELDKGTVSRMMKTFEKHGMAVKSDVSRKYRTGSGVLKLSHNIATCNNMIHIAKPRLTELADKLGTTARLCMIEGKRVFIIDQAETSSKRTIKDADVPGISKPLYCSAIGKIILAYMPPKKVDALLEKMEFTAYTDSTITNKEDLKDELLQIKLQGYALNVAEFSDYAYCIAVPVFSGKNSELKYCIGITGVRDYRDDRDHFCKIASYLKETSQQIEGYFISGNQQKYLSVLNL